MKRVNRQMPSNPVQGDSDSLSSFNLAGVGSFSDGNIENRTVTGSASNGKHWRRIAEPREAREGLPVNRV
jgi:hypothetical protein